MRDTIPKPAALSGGTPGGKKEAGMAEDCGGRGRIGGAAGGGVYGLGFIAAVVYFIGHAPSFWAGVLGFLKALVWPAFVLYKLMEHLGM